MRILIAAGIALALAACAREQPEIAGDGCALSATREIVFSNAGAPDVAIAKSEGPACDQAVVTLTLRNAEGRLLLVKAAAYYDLAFGGPPPPGAPAATPEEMQRFLESWADVTLMQTSALPPWRDGAARPNENEPGLSYDPNLARPDYEALRAADRPMLCYAVAAETSQCVVMDVASGLPQAVAAFGL